MAGNEHLVVKRAFSTGLKPDARLDVSEWADTHRVLSQTVAAEPGRWRTNRTPYLREIMNALSPHHPAKKVVMMKGAQIGGTEAGNNWVGYVIDQVPGPMIIVLPTLETAERWSKQRLATLISDSPALKKRVRDARSRDSGNTIKSKEFPGGQIIVTGANAPAGLRSMPARYRYFDEIDGFPNDVGGEGDPVKLTEKRGSTFRRGKSFLVSTPTIQGRSKIEREYSLSSRGKFYVPCPQCETYDYLTWSKQDHFHMVWKHRGDTGPNGQPLEEDDAESAGIVCPACGAFIEESSKTWMLENGKWIHEEPDCDVLGFHISSLYSPVGWLSWSQCVKEFLEAKNDPNLLKVFVNTVLGECWQDRGEAPEWQRLYERREEYRLNVVPPRALFITCGVDVQKDRLELEIVGWGRGRESWSIDYRVVPGDPETREPYLALDALLAEMFETPYQQKELRISRLAIDTGYATQAVYNWVRQQQPSRVIACKGMSSAMAAPVSVPKTVEVNYAGQRIKNGVRLWPLGVSMLKGELYRWLRLERPTDEQLEAGEPWPGGYCHFPKHSEEYFRQLTAERLVTKTVKGYQRTEWELVRPRNEALDCRVLARAAAFTLGMDRWTDSQWQRIESDLGIAGKPANSPVTPGEDDGSPKPTEPAPARKVRRGGFMS